MLLVTLPTASNACFSANATHVLRYWLQILTIGYDHMLCIGHMLLSIIGYRLCIIGYRLYVIGYEPYVIYWLYVIDYKYDSMLYIGRMLLLFIRYRPYVIYCMLLVTLPTASNGRLLSIGYRCMLFMGHMLYIIGHMLFIGYCLSIACMLYERYKSVINCFHI